MIDSQVIDREQYSAGLVDRVPLRAAMQYLISELKRTLLSIRKDDTQQLAQCLVRL